MQRAVLVPVSEVLLASIALALACGTASTGPTTSAVAPPSTRTGLLRCDDGFARKRSVHLLEQPGRNLVLGGQSRWVLRPARLVPREPAQCVAHAPRIGDGAACRLLAHPGPHPNVSGFQQSFQVAPRGLCLDDSRGVLQCLGGIRTPRGGGRAIGMSPGQDASACALRDGGVVCWGEAYSAASALDVPVPVDFEPFAAIRETAVVGPSDSGGWSAGCLIRQGCAFAPASVSPCAPGPTARAWSEVLARRRIRSADKDKW